MTEVKNLRKIEDFSRKLHEKKDPAHDFSHIKRVIKLCRKLAASEKCDMNLLLVSAYFHGVLDKEAEIRRFLESTSYSNDFINKIIGIAGSITKGGYEKQTLNETLKILEKNMKRKLLMPKAETLANEKRKFMEKFIKKLKEEL